MRIYTCKEAARLVLESQDRGLSWREHLGVRLHLLFCTACTRFAQHMRFLRTAVRRFAGQHGDASQETLAPPAKERIRHALRKHQDKR